MADEASKTAQIFVDLANRPLAEKLRSGFGFNRADLLAAADIVEAADDYDIDDDFPVCEACEEDAPLCVGCGCCAGCCSCTGTDCDCEVCLDRRADASFD